MHSKDLYLLSVLLLVMAGVNKGENRYCQEAVDSVEMVLSCPTSKEEWANAARKKNCSSIATKQKCVPANEFRYHCVINGYRDKMVEVCAPTRIIFGHCTEFNRRGGIIQDQKSAICNDKFPKCDEHYYSSDAYKYPDCYRLVYKIDDILSTAKSMGTTTATSIKTTTNSVFIEEDNLAVVSFVVLLAISVISVATLIIINKRRRVRNIVTNNINAESINLISTDNRQHEEDNTQEMSNASEIPFSIANPSIIGSVYKNRLNLKIMGNGKHQSEPSISRVPRLPIASSYYKKNKTKSAPVICKNPWPLLNELTEETDEPRPTVFE